MFLFSMRRVPIGKDQSFLDLKCVACVECAVAKLTNYFCLLSDFFALIDKDRLNPITVCFDPSGNPEDRGNSNKNIENFHLFKTISSLAPVFL